MLNGSTVVIQNCQVIKSNKIYTPRESPKGSAKDRMRFHELSRPSKRDSRSFFFTKKKTNKKNHKRGKECREHCTVFMIQNLLHCITGHKAYSLLHFMTKFARFYIPYLMLHIRLLHDVNSNSS